MIIPFVNEEALDAAKEPSEGRLRFMARYGGAKLVICQIKGQRIIEIYERRGFEEITRAEFKRLIPIVRQAYSTDTTAKAA